MLTAPLERRTGSTIVSLNTLIEEVSVVREQGWAIDQEEHAQGVCGIGVNIRSGLSEHYAISLAVPALRFHDNLEALKAALLQCKAEVEAVIGV
ncbi:hypothetical protein D0O09_17205 [Pseudomonas putida]|nr:hypothetical protein D0O09_17205 [Pseudomonas putida]